MSTNLKINIIKGIISSLSILVFVLVFLLFNANSKNDRLKREIFKLETTTTNLDNNLENFNILNDSFIKENYYVITLVDMEGLETRYLLKNTTNYTVYDFLLKLDNFSNKDFASYNGKDYYFKNGMTNILGLDSHFYDEVYGFLVVGLQAININSDIVIYNDPIPK